MQKYFKYNQFRGEKNIRLLEILYEGAKASTRYHFMQLPNSDIHVCYRLASNLLRYRKFNLVEANLDHAEGIPVYAALSYTWGNRSENTTISVDDHPLEISKNLVYALDHVVDKVVETTR